MPELPEVQTVVDTLGRSATSARILAVEVLRSDYATPQGKQLASYLVGRTIAQVQRFGKRIVFTLDNQMRFLIHLGMTGRVTVQPPGTARALHTHVVFALQRHNGSICEVHLCDPRRFGEIRWLGATPGDAGLGIEPLQIQPRQLAQVLSRSNRPIKSLLLDQARIAGLGNIYADESLFAAGIHPLTPANRISQTLVAKLCRAIKLVLRRAVRHRGSTLRDYVDADGIAGGFQKRHKVYDRAGQRCTKCRNTVHRIVLGGRSTSFCPRCQPLPKI